MKSTFLAAALVMGLCVSQNATAAPPPAQPAAAARAFVAEVRAALDEQLRDYPTARFRKVAIAFTPGGHRLVCGMVNAKSAAGGYTGWEYFWADVADGKPVALKFSTHDECSTFDVAWLPADYSGAVTR